MGLSTDTQTKPLKALRNLRDGKNPPRAEPPICHATAKIGHASKLFGQ